MLCIHPPWAQAQTVPTGYQEFYIIGNDDHVWRMMRDSAVAQGYTSFDNTPGRFINGMSSVVTATASANNQIVYYDQWEDGFEANLLNPTQATTLVIGDGNAANGRACDYTTDPRIAPCDGVNDDVLFQGSYLDFNSNQGIVGAVPNPAPPPYPNGCYNAATIPPPGSPARWRCSVPVNPRSATEVRFDGGDRLLTSGGPVSLVHTQDPLSPFIGGSTEIIAREAVANAFSYSIPIGVDSYNGDGGGSSFPVGTYEPFLFVYLDLVAYENAQVFITSPGAGTASFTLNRGQHYSSIGYIDGAPAPPIVINAGTKISTTGALGGLLFTAGPGNFATRFYALLPDRLHDTDYVITAPGDDPAVNGDRALNIYAFNPDPFNTVTINFTDSAGTTTGVVVAPNSVVDYRSATGRFVPANSTVRLTSDRNFWGISAYDHQTTNNDWGHSWLATRYLTSTYTISHAPSNFDGGMTNGNPVFVAATLDGTRVQVDFDNDGVFDAVDTDGDNVANPAPLPNNTYLINSLQSLRIYDPSDRDNTGTQIVTSRPVAVAWGQDTDLAIGGGPVPDTGYTVYPVVQSFLDPVLVLEKTVSVPYVPTTGGVVTYTIRVQSFDFGPLTNLQAYDLLPSGEFPQAGYGYVTGSTLITYPNLTQSTADPTVSIDPTTGRERLDWALAPDTIGRNQTLTIRYSVAIPPGPSGLLRNNAYANGTLGGSIFSPTDDAQVTRTDVTLLKAQSHDGSPSPGEEITYSLDVANTGVAAETNVVIVDPIPSDTTFVPGSIVNAGPFVGSYSAAQNAVVWTAANFAAGSGPFTLQFRARINPSAQAGATIRNVASYASDQTPDLPSNEVSFILVAPRLVQSKSGPVGPLHPNETATFEIRVRNEGTVAASNVRIVDYIPVNTTYGGESMEWRLNTGAFVDLTDAADADEGTSYTDRVEFVLSSLGPNEDLIFRFDVVVNAGTAWRSVNNQATVASDAVTPTDTNLVSIPIVGDAAISGHVFLDLDGDGVLDAGEPGIASTDVVVTDPTGVTQIVSTDSNGDYSCMVDVGCYRDIFQAMAYDGDDGTRSWAASPWTEFGSTADNDPATPSLQVDADPLGQNGYALHMSGSGATSKGFDRVADLMGSTSATLTFDYRRVSLEAADIVAVQVSFNGGASFTTLGATFSNGTDAGWVSATRTISNGGAPMNNVILRIVAIASFTGADDFWVDNIVLCPSLGVTANVDETDSDFPVGATLTTANDPQTIIAVAGASAAATPVGYSLPPLTIDKVSSAAGGTVAPGETITYTITITNNTAVTQTGIVLTDPLPVGTTYVAGSSQMSLPAFRVNEYYVAPGDFTGMTYDLTLAQDLATDYFIIVQGSDGDGTAANDRAPDEDYARLTRDPFGTGDLVASGASDVIRIERGGSFPATSWVGVVTVVECLTACDTAGFRLRSVEEVLHSGAGLSGSDTSAIAWTNVGQVQLVGGFNGAGCSTTDSDVADHKVCHARIYPSGADMINWTRDSGGTTSMSTATSTVMVVEWGSDWTVQRARVTGTNGGDGLDAVGEYNTAALGVAAARDNTWVWGTGHTDDNGIGDSGEGVVLTLGNGVDQNASENLVAAGTEYSGTAVDFEVYAMTHADLATDYRFKPDGDSTETAVSVAVDSAAAGGRMALVYNGQNGTGTAYPRPIFSARYTGSAAVELLRRRSGQEFPAWVQGIDFSGIAASIAVGAPPVILDGTEGYSLAPGATMTLTFQALIDDPLAPAVTQIINTATVETDQEGPYSDTTTDPVVRPGVVVEPNNADFTTAGTTVTYVHNVINASTTPGFNDSYRLTLTSELGWRVELLDPNTGAVIATDSNGDGAWDGGVTVNTGTLAPGESQEYHVRVTVPGGTPVGTQDTARLTATSNRVASVSASGEDETTVLGATDFGPVAILPDNSGVVAEGESVVYVHRVINRTGSADTFDLQAESSQGWTATIYYDSNGDGVYTPGVDVAITNTSQLANNASQLIFVVVDCPSGATPGTVDVTHLTATSRNDDTLFDGATDTTTVIVSGLDLSGGGSRLVQGGDTGVFPGTLMNLGDVDERYNFDITESSLNGLDAYDHPTQLVIDTDSDGVPDLVIAEDADGDGTWDTILGGYDTDSNSEPDVTVGAYETLAYELRRAVDINQVIHREHVTITATDGSGRHDSVTATNLLAAITRATIRGVKMRPGVIEFATGPQSRTKAFNLYELGEHGALRLLTPKSVPSPAPSSLAPLIYRVKASAWSGGAVVIEEIELGGRRRAMGPFSPHDRRLERAFERISERFDRAGLPTGNVRMAVSSSALRRFARLGSRESFGRPRHVPRRSSSSEGVKIEVAQPGWIEVLLSDLAQAGLEDAPRAPLHLTHLGRRVPFNYTRGTAGEWSIRFLAAPLTTEYSSKNVYVVTAGQPAPRPVAGLSFVTPPPAPGWTRIERDVAYVAPAPESADPWAWSMFFTDFGDWPYWEPEEGRFDLPGLPSGLAGEIPIEAHFYGYSRHTHEIEARINGYSIGRVTFEGATAAVIFGRVPAGVLLASDNSLSFSYSATPLPGVPPDEWAIACLDRVDLGVSLSPGTGTVAEISAYSAQLPRLRGVEYLIVTHRLFAEQAGRLAAAKEAQGLRTAVVDVENAYDAFTAGFADPNAVQALIRRAALQSRRLKYIVLLGDDTVDPHDNMEMGSMAYIPSQHAWHKDSGRVPSETPYTDLNGDGRPDVAIGRLPLQTPEEADAVVDKILNQTATLAELHGRHLFVADNAGDDDLPFRSEADAIASRLPAGSLVAWSDVASGAGAARAALDAAWNAGTSTVHFFGHGGPDVWTDEQLLSVETIGERLAAAPPAIVLTWTCQAQWYVYPWGPTVNEQLLLQPSAGALAAFGPAGATPPAGQKQLYDKLYDVMFAPNDMTLGEVILRSKRRALAEAPGSRSAVDTFCLFGDPALRLP